MFSFSKVVKQIWVNHVTYSVRMAGNVKRKLASEEKFHPAPIKSAAHSSDSASSRSRVGMAVCSSQPLVR
jgi:hypothetical protein